MSKVSKPTISYSFNGVADQYIALVLKKRKIEVQLKELADKIPTDVWYASSNLNGFRLRKKRGSRITYRTSELRKRVPAATLNACKVCSSYTTVMVTQAPKSHLSAYEDDKQ